MKSKILTSLFVAILGFSSTAAFSLTSDCEIGYLIVLLKETAYHEATWTAYDNYYSDMYVDVTTDLFEPFYDAEHTQIEMGLSGGTIVHYVNNPPDAYYDWVGLVMSGYPDWPFNMISYAPCAGSGVVDNEADELDDLIQEYIDNSRTPVPNRNLFVNSGSSTNFTWSEIKAPSYNYGLTSYNYSTNLFTIAEAVRAEYNARIDANPSTDYGLDAGSAYRNPVYNDQIGGGAGSLHQWGKAIDFDPAGLPPGYTTSTAMNEIYQAAASALGLTLYDIVNEGDHVHIEYDP